MVQDYTRIPGSIVLFSIGNHPISRGVKRLGVNNATTTSSVLAENYCNSKIEKYKFIKSGTKNMYWVSTHRRLKGYFDDETEPYIKTYNIDMRHFVEQNCPTMGYIDVYNMTDALVNNHREESMHMTYDSVHWGFNVNMLKTSIILNEIIF